jgi:proteasome lid subunit RPN8/RPN11
MKVRCRRAVVEQTLEYLQEAGRRESECVVLWLAHRSTDDTLVIEAYRPEQTAALDRFVIPSDSMRALMRHLREHRLSLLAQVHSHPGEAFHSWIDDREAIVRHEGALSIVAPYFARSLAADSFAEACASFRLTASDRWDTIPSSELGTYFEIVP